MFSITWKVDDAEWLKASASVAAHGAGSRYDTEYSAHYYLLYARVEMRSDSASLFARGGTDAIEVSIIDWAHQIAVAVRELEKTGRGRLSASDDAIDVEIDRVDRDHVALVAACFGGKLRVPLAEFLVGCRGFLEEVAAALGTRLPELLEWESLAEVAAFWPRDLTPEIT